MILRKTPVATPRVNGITCLNSTHQ
jgi:hypothetical protein